MIYDGSKFLKQYELVVGIMPGGRLDIQDGNLHLPQNIQVLLEGILDFPETPSDFRTSESGEYR